MKRTVSAIVLAFVLVGMLHAALETRPVSAWSNGGFSSDPSHPSYGTHDWIAQHALDWLPGGEKECLTSNLALYLYGTELPDNGGAPEGIGDVALHHVYYWANQSIQDDASAVRAQTEYDDALSYMTSGDVAMAVKTLGAMSHYIVDVGVFGDVMAVGTDWGPEIHHSDYEDYVNARTNNFTADFDTYLTFDGALDNVSAYDATLKLAFNTTFGDNGNYNCTWMDQNYGWANAIFKNRSGESLNLAVNYLADVLHTLWGSLQGILGKVNQPDGVTPIAGATVEALQVGDSVISSTATNAQGTYFLGLPIGTYKLHASATHYLTALESVINVSDMPSTVNFNLTRGTMLVFDDFAGTDLDSSKWDSHLSGLGAVAIVNATDQPTEFACLGLASGYGGSGSAAITSKLGVSSEQMIIFGGRISGYWEEHWYPGVYSDYQPRGLRVGIDPDNAIEFISYARDTVETRTVASGVATVTDYSLPSWNMVGDWNLTYRIEATLAKVKFYINDVLIATHTTNIPKGQLNIYMDTNYEGYGNVPVSADYLYLAIRIPGDLNDDLTVNLADLVLLANAYGTTPASGGTPGVLGAWNPNADIDNNGIVRLSDLVILANHYEQHYP